MRALRLLLLAALLLSAPLRAGAVILYRTGDPNENTTPPGGALAGSGWQYQGIWGGFLGTPIAPHFFIAAKHVGHGGVFVFGGVSYEIVREYPDPTSDLSLWEVAQPFPPSALAPLYTGSNEVGTHLVAFGRGTQRGAAALLGDTPKGWHWGGGDGVQRWGENQVAGIDAMSPDWHLLRASFDQIGLPNECHLSVGDSSGAAFLNDNGIWKLAGIHYAVDGPFHTDAAGNGQFFGALFDMTGFFVWNGSQFVQITAPNPAPSAFYSTRISTKLPWIGGSIAQPRLEREGSTVSLRYTRIIAAPTEVAYEVQQSSDLVDWVPAAVQEEVTPISASIQSVKASLPLGTTTRLFLRVRISRP
ncbi:MAG: hypothetical protein H0V56_11970 [Chthoniobacterales bacterium]|nr:hypothetical protein [Chthoniobacterales bacterium]